MMEELRLTNQKTYGYTPAEYAKFKEYAWKMLISFGMTYLFFYNGRQNINLVMAQMAQELGSTTAAMGVVSSALFWCYAFGQLINGRLGAYFGYKRFMMLGVAASAVLNVVISFQHSIPVIAVLWGLNGFCQSMVWSNGLGVLNKWWPKRQRGFASGLATAFSGVAQVVTYMTILLCMELNPEWGWRAAFRYPMLPMVPSSSRPSPRMWAFAPLRKRMPRLLSATRRFLPKSRKRVIFTPTRCCSPSPR